MIFTISPFLLTQNHPLHACVFSIFMTQKTPTNSEEPEYTKTAAPLTNSAPPPVMDPALKPLDGGGSGSDDSLVEYEDGDMGKFNEDGSFIGLYGGPNQTDTKDDPTANNAAKDTTTSPNALSTFV